MATVVNGTVKDFSRQDGTGTLVLESGHELTFHTMYCNTQRFEVGDVAKVQITFDSKGKRRAEAVEFELKRLGKGVTVAAAFKELKSLGLLQDWTLKEAKQQAEECFGEVPALLSTEEAAALLCHYYGAGPSARAQREGFLARDWRFGQETSDLIAEFVAALRCPPAVVLVRVERSVLTVRNGAHAAVAIDVAGGAGAIARFFQEHLKGSGQPHRLYEIATRSDEFAYVSRDGATGAALLCARSIVARLV